MTILVDGGADPRYVIYKTLTDPDVSNPLQEVVYGATTVWEQPVDNILFIYSVVTNQKIRHVDIESLIPVPDGGIMPFENECLGVGGIADRAYVVRGAYVYEIDPITGTNLSGAGVAYPGNAPRGIGGTATQLYFIDYDSAKLFELDPDTLANLSGVGVDAPSASYGSVGCGGGRVYFHFYRTGWELDPTTLANLSGAGVAVPGERMGGVSTNLFCPLGASNKIYELDPATMANISGAGFDYTFPTAEIHIGGTQ